MGHDVHTGYLRLGARCFDHIVVRILRNLSFCGYSYAVTLMWLGMLRFAVADDNGVSIFCLFLKVTRIDWDDVASAEIGCAMSPNPKVPVYMRWIILRPRANRQWQLVVGGTKRKSRVIYIAASRRNIGIIGAYVHVFGCTRYPQ